jgi:hypothetical protein
VKPREDGIAATLILLGWRQRYDEACIFGWERPILPHEKAEFYDPHPGAFALVKKRLLVADRAEDALDYEQRFGLLRR